MEALLREKERSESSLASRLEMEEEKGYKLEEEVEYLGQRLAGMESDLKAHSCEAFVESTCRNKLRQLEREVKGRYEEWSTSLGSIKSERDKALAAAR